MELILFLEGKEFTLKFVEKQNNEMEVLINDEKHNIRVEEIGPNEFLLNLNGKVHNVIIYPSRNTYSVYVNGHSYCIEKKSATKFLEEKRNLVQKKEEVKASMSGRIVKILAHEGDEVAEGQGILILEAMKMENEIKSPKKGRLTKVAISEGSSVEVGNLLFVVE
jgi:biotin carboxyl carrier protein